MKTFAMTLSVFLLLSVGCGRPGETPEAPARSGAFGAGANVGAGREFDAFIPDIRTALPEFSAFGKRNGRDVDLLARNGERIGRLRLAPDGEAARTEGFNGYIDVAVVLTPNGKVAGIAVGGNRETPRWLERVRRAGFLTRWNGYSVPDAAKLHVDAVTGATYSSTAIRDEVGHVLGR